MMKKNVNADRWKKAQAYEKHFWEKQADTLTASTTDPFSWYKDRAKLVFDTVKDYLDGFDRLVALEIGPGPIGLINFIPADERYALDPLENYNNTIPEIINARDPRVNYRQGTGEGITELQTTFNFVILDNVLDHCQNPTQVLTEAYNNLESSGVLFFSINVYKPFGLMIRNAMELFEIDKGHPFNFSEKSISTMLIAAGFDIVAPKTSDYKRQKAQYRKSGNIKHRIKGYLGLTDFRFSAICLKK